MINTKPGGRSTVYYYYCDSGVGGLLHPEVAPSRSSGGGAKSSQESPQWEAPVSQGLQSWAGQSLVPQLSPVSFQLPDGGHSNTTMVNKYLWSPNHVPDSWAGNVEVSKTDKKPWRPRGRQQNTQSSDVICWKVLEEKQGGKERG